VKTELVEMLTKHKQDHLSQRGCVVHFIAFGMLPDRTCTDLEKIGGLLQMICTNHYTPTWLSLTFIMMHVKIFFGRVLYDELGEGVDFRFFERCSMDGLWTNEGTIRIMSSIPSTWTFVVPA